MVTIVLHSHLLSDMRDKKTKETTKGGPACRVVSMSLSKIARTFQNSENTVLHNIEDPLFNRHFGN